MKASMHQMIRTAENIQETNKQLSSCTKAVHRLQEIVGKASSNRYKSEHECSESIREHNILKSKKFLLEGMKFHPFCDYEDDPAIVRRLFEKAKAHKKVKQESEFILLEDLMSALQNDLLLEADDSELIIQAFFDSMRLPNRQSEFSFEDFESSFTRVHDGMLAEIVFKEVDLNKDHSVTEDELIAAIRGKRIPEEFINLLSNKLRKKSGELQRRARDSKAIALADFKAAFSEMPRLRGERLHFVQSMGLDCMLAKLLKKGSVFDGLEGLKNMTDAESKRHIEVVIHEFVPQLREALSCSLKKLRSSKIDPKDEHELMNSKFVLDGAFEGRFATLDDFYRGPEALIGVPNPRIALGMNAEHCQRSNADVYFTADNYNVTTSPRIEWEFVNRPKKGFEYPHTPKDRSKWKGGNAWLGNCGREPQDIRELQNKPEARRAALRREEVIALRLYTGPMFVLYNAALRSFPEKHVEALRGNRYETTIFTIASGITKLSKVTGIPPGRRLFRGVGGMILPRQFWEDFEECQVVFKVTPRAGSNNLNAILQAIMDDLRSLMVSGMTLRNRNDCARSDSKIEGSECVFKKLLKDEDDSNAYLDLVNLKSHDGLNPKFITARVVKEAHISDESVMMSVALAMSKPQFVDNMENQFKEAVKNGLTNRNEVAVDIENIADKPLDFRGGGMQRVIQSIFLRI